MCITKIRKNENTAELKKIENAESIQTQVYRYGYPYFHRKFATYGAVNGPYFLVILSTEIRHRIRAVPFDLGQY
jgi:hypothetical protein